MSLIEFVQKLQDKPRHIRVQILWLSVLVFMVIIFSLWIFSLKYSLSEVKEEKGPEIKKELPSLKEAFKASIGSFFEKDIEITPTSPEVEVEKELKQIKPGILPLSKTIND